MKKYFLKSVLLTFSLIICACNLFKNGNNSIIFTADKDNVTSSSPTDQEPETTPEAGFFTEENITQENSQDESDYPEITQVNFINHSMPNVTILPLSLETAACDDIQEVPASMGGLTSDYAMAFCLEHKTWEEVGTAGEADFLFQKGCRMPVFVSLLLEKDGQLINISSSAQLAEMFAPIDTPEKALAFAQAVTGFEAYFDLKYDPKIRYLSETIEDSYAEEIKGEYRVLLYDFQLCGCGPHSTSTVEVLVSQDGEITTGEYIPAFEDPEMDSLCVD